ncbi:MAG: NAD-dependent epimerase/dehydratase family protein [Spirochaetia bacterium]|nr:NAD-dependent epimerase/dehydratase family protein [Spirochaetia bacterium]
MNIVLAGAFGKLGSEILRVLVKLGHSVLAVDLNQKDIGLPADSYRFSKIDVTDKSSLKGLFTDAELCISTVGLTGISKTHTNEDIDYQGNLNLLEEAKQAGVKKFIYVSVIQADSDDTVPMLNTKARFESVLKSCGLEYVIIRPTGYFYDIAKVFKPMIEKGKVTLLGRKDHYANVIDTRDLALFIAEHLCDEQITLEVGGKETYSYKQIATLFFEAAGKKPKFSYAPLWLFSLLIFINKKKATGKEAIIRFSKWTLTHDLVGEHRYGTLSFKDYIAQGDYI